MILQTGLKRKKSVKCMIGYSGKIINKKYLSNNINSKPKTFLMHGANDTIVPPTHLLESKEYLSNHGIKIKTKLFNKCEHTIPTEGISLGLEFLKKKSFIIKIFFFKTTSCNTNSNPLIYLYDNSCY